jgi:hypothetical protein
MRARRRNRQQKDQAHPVSREVNSDRKRSTEALGGRRKVG